MGSEMCIRDSPSVEHVVVHRERRTAPRHASLKCEAKREKWAYLRKAGGCDEMTSSDNDDDRRRNRARVRARASEVASGLNIPVVCFGGTRDVRQLRARATADAQLLRRTRASRVLAGRLLLAGRRLARATRFGRPSSSVSDSASEWAHLSPSPQIRARARISHPRRSSFPSDHERRRRRLRRILRLSLIHI